MAVTTPVMYKGMYLGDKEPEQADLIIEARKSKEVPNLKQSIFDFPPELIQESMQSGVSIRDKVVNGEVDPNKYLGELRGYQTVGTAFMYLNPRSILGDGVGLGKTAQVGSLLNFLKHKGELTRFLMAVDVSAMGQTQSELIRFTGLNVIQLPSQAAPLRRAIKNTDWSEVDGIIIKHTALRSDVLSKWLALNINEKGLCDIFNTFILDESSVIKNKNTKIYDYTKNICDIVPRVHFLNATTFETHIMDIYNQVDMMDKSVLPRKYKVEKEFCTFGTSTYWTSRGGKPKMNFRRDLTGYKNQEVFKNVLKLTYLARSKSEVKMDRPNTYKVYEVVPTNNQTLALAKGYRYMEVLNCPSLIEDLKMETSSRTVPKMKRLVELVERDFSSDSVMVYCFHRDAQYALSKELKKIGRTPAILNGGIPTDERHRIQNKFNSGEYDVLITNMQKSLNLHGGDVCIFYSVVTNPSKMEQTAGRIDRNIDNKNKTFVLMLYKGTDEYKFFVNNVQQRAQDSRDLTIDAKGTVDAFIESMGDGEE